MDDAALPAVSVGLYDWTLAWDHGEERCWLISSGFPEAGRGARKARARRRADEVLRRLGPGGARRREGGEGERGEAGAWSAGGTQRENAHRPWSRFHDGGRRPGRRPGERAATLPLHPVPEFPRVRSTFSRDGYLAAVRAVREHILAGDVFQVNISQRLQLPFEDDPFALHRRLSLRNPAPFSAYLEVGGAAIASASPERFLRVEGGEVDSSPIKGTIARGRTPAEDLANRKELHASEKDRAENIMIVDLVRNDLSKVCEDHTVEVPRLCEVEEHPAIFHLVSTVKGRLRAGKGPLDLLEAAFPGGSITGAPKLRAMEIIAEIEPTLRGAYTGSIGYIGFDGTMDMNVAIRTFVVRDGVAYLQAGGGIVADSDPAAEYEETLAKARGLLSAVEGAGET